MLASESDEELGEATPAKKTTRKGKGDARALVASKRASAGFARPNPKCVLECISSTLSSVYKTL
jgi:hypothetical protein